MRKSMIIAIAVIMSVAILAISVSAQSDDKNQQRITLELKDTPIRSALDALFKGRGLSYSITADVSGNVGSLSLRDVTFDLALKMLLKAVDPPLVYRKEGDVYIISVKKDQPENTFTQQQATADITPTDTTEAEDVKMEKITLSFVDAYDLKAIIEGQNTSRSSSNSNGWGSSGSSNGWGSSGSSSGWGSSGSNSWGSSGSNSWGSSSSSSSSNYGRFSGRSGY